MSNNTEVKPEIKPCPCCGGIAVTDRQDRWHVVECTEIYCGIRTQGFATKLMAVETWNHRPQPVEANDKTLTEQSLSAIDLHFARKRCEQLEAENEKLKAVKFKTLEEALEKSASHKLCEADIVRAFPEAFLRRMEKLKTENEKLKEHIVTDNEATLDNALRENEELKSSLSICREALERAKAALGDNAESQALGGRGIEKGYYHNVSGIITKALVQINGSYPPAETGEFHPKSDLSAMKSTKANK
jgi:hypothetical protein